MIYPSEHFSAEERARLAPYFTNIDRPVFALVNLPEAVKGAMFARYSRYPGTLRRLFLDEFADGLPERPLGDNTQETRRAAELYERVFVGFGDDSVAQLGGAHLACEWTSNVVTKVLQRPRLASYLEQSTRYIPYDRPMPAGGYRYYRDPSFGARYAQAMDEIFDLYSRSIPQVRRWVEETYPRSSSEPAAAYERACSAKALDVLRGMLPAASLSHMGIFASGQSYEQLVLALFSSSLPEARLYGEMMLNELRCVIPSFLSRVDRPDRGDAWVGYLKRRTSTAARLVERLGLGEAQVAAGPSVQLIDVAGTEAGAIAALLFEAGVASDASAREVAERLSNTERAELLATLAGDRANRRNRPGRGLETIRYRFEIVADYGAFRDLQRHRMLTVQWQPLTPALGASVPEDAERAGVGGHFRRALELSQAEHRRLCDEGLASQAMYPLCMAYRIRFVLEMNAREAMHVIELRSGRQGHANYRTVAQQMHRLIAAEHPAIAAMMVHVDHDGDERLGRRDTADRARAIV